MTLRFLSIIALLAASVPGQGDRGLKARLRDHLVPQRWVYNDWPAARSRARSSGRPLFALFRCVP